MNDKYSAAGSMIGYMYQSRYALLAGIEASKSKPSLGISIERFDDVAFEKDDAVQNLIQTKHHGTAGDLSDKSVDLWKTLRIWCDRVKLNPRLPFETKFTILTTGSAPDGSAAALLRIGQNADDRKDAVDKLICAAETSRNVATAEARQAFLQLLPEYRLGLVTAIDVIDMAPNITDVRAEIEDVLWIAAPAEHVSTLVDYLEGWWFNLVIQSLEDTARPAISVLSIRQKIDELGEAFRTGGLPLDEQQIAPPSAEALTSDNRTFVQQLRSVVLSERMIGNAVRDYYRASAQRSRWARENLLLDDENRRYDDELVDRWDRTFEAKKDGADLTDEAKKQECGRKIFHWANGMQYPFRNRNEMWLTAGSFQSLADDLRVGWHPKFRDIFASPEGDE